MLPQFNHDHLSPSSPAPLPVPRPPAITCIISYVRAPRPARMVCPLFAPLADLKAKVMDAFGLYEDHETRYELAGLVVEGVTALRVALDQRARLVDAIATIEAAARGITEGQVPIADTYRFQLVRRVQSQEAQASTQQAQAEPLGIDAPMLTRLINQQFDESVRRTLTPSLPAGSSAFMASSMASS